MALKSRGAGKPDPTGGGWLSPIPAASMRNTAARNVAVLHNAFAAHAWLHRMARFSSKQGKNSESAGMVPT